MTYSVYYKAPTYSKVYTAPVYSKVLVPKKPTVAPKAKASTTVQVSVSGNSTKKEAPKKDPNGTKCDNGSSCMSFCCSKNIPVMPSEGNEDLYGLRTQYYNSDSKTYSPPGGKVYSYADKSTGGYSTTYGCYGGAYYDIRS